MLSFRQSSDPDSLRIYRNDNWIGFFLKHPGREPRIILHDAETCLTQSELKLCSQKLDEFVTNQ